MVVYVCERMCVSVRYVAIICAYVCKCERVHVHVKVVCQIIQERLQSLKTTFY